MALGGGTFITENKVLPGSYINFASLANTSVTLADRGVAAVVMPWYWGKIGVTEITKETFMKNSLEYFGYAYSASIMFPFREIFKHAKKICFYRLGDAGAYAENDYATAKYKGYRGNSISIEILNNADKTGYYDVTTYMAGTAVDSQTVADMSELANNSFVNFKDDAVIEVTATGGAALSGGSSSYSQTEYQTALDTLESYSFNALLLPLADDETVTDLFVEYTKRRRDEEGVKFQLVAYRVESDYEGVISVYNESDFDCENDLVFWVGGVAAGMNVNESALNLKYDGEIPISNIKYNFTQSELEDLIEEGQFVLHKVDDDLRVLADINTLTTTTESKGEIFKSNQTVRVCDQIAGDIARLFNTYYLGIVPNDTAGRLSLWNDIVKHHQSLNTLRAIEDFSEEDITVEIGDTKESVVVNDCVTVVNAMGKLYMTVVVQ